MPIRMLVIIAGVEWNCVNVYKIMPIYRESKRKMGRKKLWSSGLKWVGRAETKIKAQNPKSFYWIHFLNLPVKNIGMEIKKPPTAQTRLTLDFCKYLLPLKIWKNKEFFIMKVLISIIVEWSLNHEEKLWVNNNECDGWEPPVVDGFEWDAAERPRGARDTFSNLNLMMGISDNIFIAWQWIAKRRCIHKIFRVNYIWIADCRAERPSLEFSQPNLWSAFSARDWMGMFCVLCIHFLTSHSIIYHHHCIGWMTHCCCIA